MHSQAGAWEREGNEDINKRRVMGVVKFDNKFMLFEDIDRNDDSHIKCSEKDYEFYDRNSLDWVTSYRNDMNKWFQNYLCSCISYDEKNEMLCALKSKDFESAFFELYLHEIFYRNFTLEIHPEIKGFTTHPDFLIKNENMEFYLEVKCAKIDDNKLCENNFIDKVVEDLNNLNFKKYNLPYWLMLERINLLKKQQPSAKRILKEIKNSLNSNQVCGNYKDEKIEFQFKLFEKHLNKKKARLVGSTGAKCYWSTLKETIIKNFENKANKYGNLVKPYLIWINIMNKDYLDKEEIEETINKIFADKSNENVSGIAISKIYPQNRFEENKVFFCLNSKATYKFSKYDFKKIFIEEFSKIEVVYINEAIK